MSFGSFGPRVSHLFFVDDSFVYFKANIDEGMGVGSALKECEGVSGQVVNYDKSDICFGRDVEYSGGEAIVAMLVLLRQSAMRAILEFLQL